MIEVLWVNKQTMGNTGLGKHKDVHNSDSTLEFETGKKMFPSEQEAKMILSGACYVCMIPIHIQTHPKERSMEFLGRAIQRQTL